MHLYGYLCKQKLMQRNSTWSDSFQSIFQQALLSYSAKELPETAVKARKRCLMTELRTSQPLLTPPLHFCLHDKLSFLLQHLKNDTAISTGHVQVNKYGV